MQITLQASTAAADVVDNFTELFLVVKIVLKSESMGEGVSGPLALASFYSDLLFSESEHYDVCIGKPRPELSCV